MNAARAVATRSITSAQLPRSRWRNSPMEGYQKLVSPVMPQRQSGTVVSSNQVGCPIPAAKWATTVSQVMTRSQLAIIATVSTKSQVRLISS